MDRAEETKQILKEIINLEARLRNSDNPMLQRVIDSSWAYAKAISPWPEDILQEEIKPLVQIES